MKYIKLYENFNTTPAVDKVLDKISKSGYNSLTDQERLIVNMMSDMRTIDDKPQYKEIRINKTFTDSTDTIRFVLDYVISNSNENIYHGAVYHADIRYTGTIIKNKETEVYTYDFYNITDFDDIFEPVEYDLHYEFDNLIELIIYDEEIEKMLE